MAETKSSTVTKTVHPDRSAWLSQYESIFVLPNDQPDEAGDKVAERLRGVVEREGGRVIKFTYWGRRKTAFDVRKSGKALFVQMDYLGKGRIVDEIERNLRNSEEVVKFHSARVAKLVDPATKPTEADVRMVGDLDERALKPVGPEGGPEIEGVPEELADEAIPEVGAAE